MKNRIMAHMVAFYPSREKSLETARALIDGGCTYLEVQFPFSDPTADGPYIQEACKQALEKGFKISGGFELIGDIRTFSNIPIFIMCYANTIFYYGIEQFLECCVSGQVQGLIVPDLPVDYDEGLFEKSECRGLEPVPVIAQSTKPDRLDMILKGRSEFVYAAIRKGITGSFTDIGEENIQFLTKVDSFGKKILAGFGISEKHQIEAISSWIHAAVVGTAFIKEIIHSGKASIYNVIKKKIQSLI
ncbi:MAG: tryptophan synthase subunit alpha [Spirochaetota bacterium]|nr:MAG: tryptophan synthase subunit alpha [Spirochaetota bacterium]